MKLQLQKELINEEINIPVQFVGSGKEYAQLPAYMNPGDAGADLYAAETVALDPRGGRRLISTGIAIAIPEGYAGFVQPRSGLASKHGITCLNTPGLIDSGYRGEIKVLLINTDPKYEYKVEAGTRIAQLVIQKVENVNFSPTDSLDETQRGAGGFGSSGK